MRRHIFTFLFLIIFTIISSVSVFAYSTNNSINNATGEIIIPVSKEMNKYEIQEMLSNSINIKSSSETPYEIVFVDELELQTLIDQYQNNYNQHQRNILPNLVAMTLTKNNPNSVSLKITNIAVDSLDLVYGNIYLYDNIGYNGSTSFRFTQIPPFKSDYAMCFTLYGPFTSGMYFVDSTDGTITNNGVWYF